MYAKPVTTANRITRGMRLPRTPMMTPCNEQRSTNEWIRKASQDKAYTEIIMMKMEQVR